MLVDYAHKPDAVAAAVRTLRPLTDGRVIVVLGAGGDRDPGKRPMMGEIAARLADVFIVTDDNPRSEDPAAIRKELLDGAVGGRAEVVEIGDRRSAIREALRRARDRRHRPGRGQGTRGRPGDRGRRSTRSTTATSSARSWPLDDRPDPRRDRRRRGRNGRRRPGRHRHRRRLRRQPRGRSTAGSSWPWPASTSTATSTPRRQSRPVRPRSSAADPPASPTVVVDDPVAALGLLAAPRRRHPATPPWSPSPARRARPAPRTTSPTCWRGSARRWPPQATTTTRSASHSPC